MVEENQELDFSLRVIDKNQRFSHSLLWKLQENSYSQAGPEAWIKGVPFYITSNPFIAKSYAHMALGFFRDCMSERRPFSIDLTEPFYIFDLGAGTGRFGFLFLKELLTLLKDLFGDKIKIRYVMTDFVSSNLSFWEQHSILKEYVNQGILDFAILKHGEFGQLLLEQSKVVLTPENVKNPLLLMANYYFDVLPQDLFRVQNHQLEEGLVTLAVPKNPETEPLSDADPGLLPHLQFHYTYRPIENPETYYPDIPAANAVLKDYGNRFENASFVLSLAAFQTIEYFANLSQNRMLLIAGDQGVCNEEQILRWGEPKIACQGGAFSLGVSYDAVSRFFTNKGGAGFVTHFSKPIFIVSAGILGGDISQFPETAVAFRVHLDDFEPSDYWHIVENISDQKTLSLELILDLLKLGNWDSINFYYFFETIRKELPTASVELKEYLTKVIYKVADNFYPIRADAGDFLLNLGVLLFDMQLFQQALTFFERSIEISGENETVLNNIGACYLSLGDRKKWMSYTRRAKRFEP